MKLVSKMLSLVKPLFEEGGRLRPFWPVFQATDNFFFSHKANTLYAPYGRDPIDVKRYMSLVILAMMPAFLASLYFFGPRVLVMIFVSYLAGGIVEMLFSIIRKEEINEGFLVTGFIFPLILPPGLPLWMVAVGSIFGVLVGKEVFGGTGRNLFNAALVGRCFLVFAYPARMTSSWLAPGPDKWLNLPGSLAASAVDSTTMATPLGLAKAGEMTSTLNLLIGNIGGSIGETSAIAILVGSLFLMAVGVASWRTITGGMVALLLSSTVLHLFMPQSVPTPLFHLLSGGWLFGIMFMATDPVSGPVTGSGRWAYGILIGVLTVLIRNFSGFVEGAMFAILFGNICAPLIDDVVIRIKKRDYARQRIAL